VTRDVTEEEVVRVVMVLFDLGETLESDGVLRDGALDALEELAGLRRDGGPAVVLGLLSDTRVPVDAADVTVIAAEYRAVLDALGIRRFFEPLARHVTLSAEVGARKPAAVTFRTAVARADPALTFADVVFGTETPDPVRAARRLGLTAVHVRPAGAPDAAGAELPDVLALVRDLLGKPAAAG
jgi:FMN phosphatase YigB (HAD superfamily)